MFTLNCNGRLLVVDKPLVMGIINITPDSFFAGSRYKEKDSVISIAGKMLEQGASIIDIGGQSTRPGSMQVSADEELIRVIAVIDILHRKFPHAFISIDTYYGLVAKEAAAAGASIINDISAGALDADMIPAVAQLKLPYVLMHMQGTPGSMQQSPAYKDVTSEVFDFLLEKKTALQNAGIHDLIIDPGFGFGKTAANNFRLLKDLPMFKVLQAPILLGVSRKSTIAKTLGITTEETLNGSTVLHTMGLMNGASILRVHDVKEAVEAVKLFLAYQA